MRGRVRGRERGGEKEKERRGGVLVCLVKSGTGLRPHMITCGRSNIGDKFIHHYSKTFDALARFVN